VKKRKNENDIESHNHLAPPNNKVKVFVAADAVAVIARAGVFSTGAEVMQTLAKVARVGVAEGAHFQIADAVTVHVVERLVFRRRCHGANIHGGRVGGNKKK